jgi:hypothetical protein
VPSPPETKSSEPTPLHLSQQLHLQDLQEISSESDDENPYQTARLARYQHILKEARTYNSTLLSERRR